ncbi:MAG: hypothetical protein HY287_11190 [Planctomycetes bacterium]|nr:hypothetical protein [Planctomycetota bacterium]MBI3834883.1 hypothetical protein [Planctomycetota bacterium]
MTLILVNKVLMATAWMLAAGPTDPTNSAPVSTTDSWPKSPEFWISVAGLAGVILAALVWFLVAATRRGGASPVGERDTLRFFTVITIVVATASLSLLGKADGTQVLILFGAIAGFILGTSADKRIALHRPEDSSSNQQRSAPNPDSMNRDKQS